MTNIIKTYWRHLAANGAVATASSVVIKALFVGVAGVAVYTGASYMDAEANSKNAQSEQIRSGAIRQNVQSERELRDMRNRDFQFARDAGLPLEQAREYADKPSIVKKPATRIRTTNHYNFSVVGPDTKKTISKLTGWNFNKHNNDNDD